MCVLFEFRQFFFTLGTRLRIDLCKKSDRTMRFQFLSTILTRIRSRQRELKRFGFLKCSDSASEHRRPGLSNSLNQWTFMTCK